MWINARIIGYENREIPSDQRTDYLTVLYLRDVDSNCGVYTAHVYGDRVYRFKLNDIVTFKIMGVHGNNRQICLSLDPQECNRVSGAVDGGRAFTREPPSTVPPGATPSNTAPPKYIKGESNGF